MAINVVFNGASIVIPGSYSQSIIDLSGGLPLGPAGNVAIFGEADAGTPGNEEVDSSLVKFTADQLVSIRNKYRSGPIVDACSFLFAPAADAAIPSGAQTVWIYKTNGSVRSSLALANTYGTVQALEYGIGGNMLSYQAVAVAESAPATQSSAPFVETSIATSSTFKLHINGGPVNTFTFPAITNKATLVTALAAAGNWSGGVPAGISIVVGGVDGACTVSFTLNAAANQYQLGFGRSFELSGSGGALSAMNLSAGLFTAALEPSVTITNFNTRDNLQESSTLGGPIVLSLSRLAGVGITSASVTITSSSLILNENAVAVWTFPLSSFSTIAQLAAQINMTPYVGWKASVTSSVYNQLAPSVLDEVTAVGALSEDATLHPARIKMDAASVADFYGNSSMASMLDQLTVGLPGALAQTPLSGGLKGGTSGANVVAALASFEKIHVNSVVPLFSRDATADIADLLTDASSTYSIAAIHQAVKTHLSFTATTKKRSERQGYLSMKDSYANCKIEAGVMADARIQMAIQDIRQINSAGNILWFQPWALSCLLAGARGGAPVGEPLTHKFLNASGVRQTAQPLSTPESSIHIDFDPDLEAEDAINSGITFLQVPQTGGFRVVVDNTTYGVDASWIYNRANVLYAADIVAFNLRNALELSFIGKKNNVLTTAVVSVATSTLTQLLNNGVTVSTPDAPKGFKSLNVVINGNVITVDVVIKLVEGIDFILSTINIQRATSA